MSPPAVTPGRWLRLRRRALHGLLAGGAAAAAALALRPTRAMEVAELKSHDLRASRLADAGDADTSIVVVQVDDRTLMALRDSVGRWPFPRRVHASVVEYLAYAGARLVVFDVAFPEPDRGDPLSDSAFAEAIGGAGNVVLPATFAPGDADDRARNAVLAPGWSPILDRFAVETAAGVGMPDWPRIDLPLPMLAAGAAGIGNIHMAADTADGTLRRDRPLGAYDGRVYPSLALAAARLLDGARFGGAVSADEGELRVGPTRVPLHDGRLLLRWHGALSDERRPVYRTYSYFQLSTSYDRVATGYPPVVPPEELRGKTVFVATNAAGLLDLRVTPVGSREPGVILHATALDNLLHGDWIRRAPPWANAGAVVVASLLAALLVSLVGSAGAGTAAGLAVVAAAVGGGVGGVRRRVVAGRRRARRRSDHGAGPLPGVELDDGGARPAAGARPLLALRGAGARPPPGGRARDAAPGRRAGDGDAALQRHPRLHLHLRGAPGGERGGDAERVPGADGGDGLPPRRHARQVHRRRRDGVLGGAHPPRPTTPAAPPTPRWRCWTSWSA